MLYQVFLLCSVIFPSLKVHHSPSGSLVGEICMCVNNCPLLYCNFFIWVLYQPCLILLCLSFKSCIDNFLVGLNKIYEDIYIYFPSALCFFVFSVSVTSIYIKPTLPSVCTRGLYCILQLICLTCQSLGNLYGLQSYSIHHLFIPLFIFMYIYQDINLFLTCRPVSFIQTALLLFLHLFRF